MSEMVERAAKALCQKRYGLWDYWKHRHAEFLGDARVVIEAMREPTAEMLLAVAPFPIHLVIERADVDYTKNMEAATAADRMAARSQYQIMIDAALNVEE